MADINLATATYSDLNPDIGQSPLGELVYDVDAINSSVENILGTRFGERWFYPDFGSFLYSVLFDPMNARTEMIIKTEIMAAIGRWEPRIKIISVSISADYDQQIYNVLIVWKYLKLNQVNNLPIALRRL